MITVVSFENRNKNGHAETVNELSRVDVEVEVHCLAENVVVPF